MPSGSRLKSILEHKLRAFLTLIGIIIGVAAVIVVGASIAGSENVRDRPGLKGSRFKPLHDDPHGLHGTPFR